MGAVVMDVEVGFIETDPRIEEFLLAEDEESYEASWEEEDEGWVMRTIVWRDNLWFKISTPFHSWYWKLRIKIAKWLDRRWGWVKKR